MTPTDAALVLGATARLTRLVTRDDLGQWWIKDPVEQAAISASLIRGEEVPWARYADGLDCPWCVGTWIGYGVLGTTLAVKGTRLERPWRFVMAGLTLNLVTVTAGKAAGIWDE